MSKFGIIGGTSLLKTDLFKKFSTETIDNNIDIYLRGDLIFLQRHGRARNVPPHSIDHRAHISALKRRGVERIVAVASVGSLKANLLPGTIVIPDDYINLFNTATFYDDEIKPIVPGFDDELRERIITVFENTGASFTWLDSGVYFQTRGPRFETKAEVEMLKEFADIVGMTVGSEATLARERAIPYAAVCCVDNFANGVSSNGLTPAEFDAKVADNLVTMETIVKLIVDELLGDKDEYFD